MPLLNKQAGAILGHNARTLWYSNVGSAKAASIAHDKLATKKLLQKAGLPTPRLYALIQSRRDLANFRWTKLPASFVLKPKSASGGSGIMIIFGRNKKGNWVKADKSEVFTPQLKKHVQNILDGSFSASHVPDTALFEQRLKIHPALKPFSTRGIPDIRIIVSNSIPVMAMLRLSTPDSHGRANLHAGGIGVGIDMGSGLTTTAISHGQLIETLPGSQLHLAGIKVPQWQNVLLTAVKAAAALELPFAGVDIALDRDDGPVVLEINAHPGLDIQLANLAPLRSRLQRVADLSVTEPAKGVQIGRNVFGSDVEQEIEDITGKAVLGIIEPISITGADGEEHHLQAKIDTGAWRSTIDRTLAKKLGLHSKVIQHETVRGALGREKRPVIELNMQLHNQPFTTRAFSADRSKLKYPMIIGRRDLKGFLVDPYKNTHVNNEDKPPK